MAYGIFRVAKAKASDLGGLEAEANRTETNRKDFPGSSIDWEKTKNNEYLVKTNGWKRSIDEIIKENGCRVRSNSTYVIDCIFTASADFFKEIRPETEKAFFQDCLDFCKSHLGVVKNAVIHRDESTPHLHVACVPLIDRGNGKHSLSAKDILGGNADMHKLQDLVFKEVFEKYGLQRGEVRDPVTRREHLDTLDYKLKVRAEEVKAAEAEKMEIEQDIGKLEQIRDIIASVRDIAGDLFNRIYSAVKEGFSRLCDKIEHMQIIKVGDLVAADCKMSRCATYRSEEGDQVLYTPKTNAGEALSWAGNRPVYGLDSDTYYGILKMDAGHRITTINASDWKNEFSRENRDFNNSVCDRDIVSLEEKIDLIDYIVNDDDIIDTDCDDLGPPDEIDYNDTDIDPQEDRIDPSAIDVDYTEDEEDDSDDIDLTDVN